MNRSAESIHASLVEYSHSTSFTERMAELLCQIVDIDTTPSSDIVATARRETQLFAILENRLQTIPLDGASARRVPINTKIDRHPFYSKPYYTRTPECPDGAPPDVTYRNRFNLVYTVPGHTPNTGRGLAINSHIDVVAPWFGHTREGNEVMGRGTCDDKGACVAQICALELLPSLLDEFELSLEGNLVSMFVIEEETGGNGSLSLAIDRDLKSHYDSVLVLECTDNDIHPANRGAVWYRTELRDDRAPLLEMASFVITEMEAEGRAIRSESRHDLFPQRPVQTCHGIIGPWGKHPSRICGNVAFRVRFDRPPLNRDMERVRDVMDSAIEAYTGIYGDLTKPGSDAEPARLNQHYDIEPDGNDFLINVYGTTGHMGAIFENDDAITKMAWMVQSLIRSRNALGGVTMRLDGQERSDVLVLEGGQGFVPTHHIDEVTQRIAKAIEFGAETYLQLAKLDGRGSEIAVTTFDKLHNAAFDGDPDSPSMQRAIRAAKESKTWRGTAIRGWTVSCDARIFATEYPGMPVLTSGPGQLAHAHSDTESVDLEDIRKSIEFLVLYMLMESGSIPS